MLDLTFSTPQLRPFLTNWTINYKLATGSDHEVIQFTLQAEKTELVDSPLTGPYNLQKADWLKFSTILKEKENEAKREIEAYCQTREEGGLEQAALVLQNLLLKALEESVPRRRPSTRSKAWWSPSLTKLRQQMLEARRISKQLRTTKA